jgi:LmbE family N-acetylglucosaminyl deacetylase
VLSPDRLAQVRAEEVTEACSRLGVEPGELILLGHREGTLSDDPAVITGQLTEQIDDFGPDEVLVTSARDWHLDHQILNRAASDAVAALGRPTSLRLREYPVWLWADGPWRAPRTGPAVARAFKPITEPRSIAAEHVSTAGFVDIKREALMCHRSQTTNITGEPGWPVLDRSFLDKFLGPVEIFLAPSTLI